MSRQQTPQPNFWSKVTKWFDQLSHKFQKNNKVKAAVPLDSADEHTAPIEHTTRMPRTQRTSANQKRPNIFVRAWNRTVLWAEGLRHGLVDRDGSNPSAMMKPRTKRPPMVFAVLATTFKLFLVVILIAFSAGAGALAGIIQAHVNTTPELDIVKVSDTNASSYIYDTNGDLITIYTGSENRDPAKLQEIPKMLQYAVIATEDSRFYSHSGIDIKRLVGALLGNFLNNTTQGASTITQQLIKNTMLSAEQSYKRKIQEAYLSLNLERLFTKDEILETYLNYVNLGSSNYGVKAAAKDYFGKELNELTIRECALIAGIIQNPTYYNPRRNYYGVGTKEATIKRTDQVLYRMYRDGYLSTAQYEAALEEEVVILETSSTNQLYPYTQFVEYVINNVIDLFIQQRGLENTKAVRNQIEQEIRTSGYHIYSTIDPTVQTTLEETVYNFDKYPALKNAADSISVSGLKQPQASAVIIDHHTGQIKGMVGSSTQPDARKLLNRAVDSHMPIGSTIKPIAVFGPAIEEMGLGAGTVIQNIPSAIEGWESESGYPYEGPKAYRRPVTLREAIMQSLNLSAARVLMELSGEVDIALDRSLRYLEALGINMSERYVKGTPAGIALGTNGISTLELTAAYATIANGGVYITPIAFTTVTDSEGKVLLDATTTQEQRRVFLESTAWLLVDIMEDVISSGTGRSARISGMTVAGKTGTNDGYRGVTFAGMTAYYTSAVWIGSDDYASLQSSATAAPLWQSYMSKIHEGLENQSILDYSAKDAGLKRVRVCAVSGMVPTEACEHDEGEMTPVYDWFVEGTEPIEECNMHIPINICDETGLYATEFCETTTAGSIVIIPQPDPELPEDEQEIHVLQTVDPELLEKYVPWFHNMPLEEFTAELMPELFCNVHNEGWLEEKLARVIAIEQANTVLIWAKNQLTNYNAELSLSQKSEINSLATTVQTLLDDPTSTAAQISAASSNLQTRTLAIINSLW